MRFPYVVAVALFLGTSVACRADSYTTFDLTVMFHEGSGGGTVTLDDTTASFTAADVTVTYLGVSYVFDGAPTPGGFGEFDGFDVTDAQGDTLSLLFPVNTFVGYAGGGLCNDGGNCTFGMGPQDAYSEISGGGGDPFPLVDPLLFGGLTSAASATPEPSALLLMGTGMALLAEFGRRRRA